MSHDPDESGIRFPDRGDGGERVLCHGGLRRHAGQRADARERPPPRKAPAQGQYCGDQRYRGGDPGDQADGVTADAGRFPSTVLVMAGVPAVTGARSRRVAGGCGGHRDGVRCRVGLRHQPSDRSDRVDLREPPVEQGTGILGVCRDRPQHGDDEGVVTTPDRADVGGARRNGVAVLDADRPRIGAEQLVVILDLEGRAAAATDGRPRDRQESPDGGAGEGGPAQQCKIVCRCRLAGDVQAGRVPGVGVARVQIRRDPVHRRDRGRGATGGFGECDGRVVATCDDHGSG